MRMHKVSLLEKSFYVAGVGALFFPCSAVEDTQPDSVIAPVQDSVLEPDSSVSDSSLSDSPPEESLDSSKYKLSYFLLGDTIETVYYKDTCYPKMTLHDTLYDTLYSDVHYTSFVYKTREGSIDTVTGTGVSCEFTDSTFACKQQIVYEVQDCCGPLPLRDSLIFVGPYTSRAYCLEEVVDSVYGQPVHLKEYVFNRDTTFINYGESRNTDYVPREYEYETGENPFDSVLIRDLFDTLDLRDSSSFQMEFWMNSRLTFTDFPLKLMYSVKSV